MRKLLLLLGYVYLVQGGPTKKQVLLDQQADAYGYEYAQREPALSLANSGAYLDAGPGLSAAPVSPGRSPPKPGYSVGGPLANIAKGAADDAHTQLANQQSAAGQAAYVAKNTLAQAAAQSAATAAAALAGKQIVVQGLEQQSRDAHVAVDGESLQLQQAERAASAARTTAKQAMHQLQVITAALNAAQTTVDRASQAAAEAAAELAAQTTMLGQAKARAETVDEQLSAARVDYGSTQAAADKAATAAAAAQNNAQAAAASVADTAGQSALLSHQPVEPAPSVKLPQSPLRQPVLHNGPVGLQESEAILAAGGLEESGLLSPGVLDAGALQAAGRLRASNGLHRSELISLANAIPADGYDTKGYRY
ncbi:PREDICTED: uncharacterized protein LOC107188135 [Dufourea novaeangliae]|uniref:uncharacterized protein LOC107188135 n=1 Tax=Dufourea novaeangliae TaxID=178035 RepID=UPI0007674BF6|nr:PREDICTED: uncharacterized protein LOC107188135 [Dufourea novaeangliae]